jgi:hypothetical protein
MNKRRYSFRRAKWKYRRRYIGSFDRGLLWIGLGLSVFVIYDNVDFIISEFKKLSSASSYFGEEGVTAIRKLMLACLFVPTLSIVFVLMRVTLSDIFRFRFRLPIWFYGMTVLSIVVWGIWVDWLQGSGYIVEQFILLSNPDF